MSNSKNLIDNVSFNAEGIQAIPGMDSLGRGYDIFGFYAEPKSAKLELFNFQNEEQQNITLFGITYSKPNLVIYQDIDEATFKSSYGNTISEYVKSIDTATSLGGDYNGFGGSLAADFKSTELQNSSYEYTKISYVIEKWSLSLPSQKILIGMLNEEVKNDLDGDLEPNQIFSKYGTHFLNNIIVGAKVDYSIATDKTKYQKKDDVLVVAEMSYKQLVGSISAEEKVSYGTDISLFNKSSQAELKVYGGDPEYASSIMNATEDKKGESYDKWINSIGNHPVFCEFGSNGLVPIWNLCSDDERRSQLVTAFEAYAKEKSKPLL